MVDKILFLQFIKIIKYKTFFDQLKILLFCIKELFNEVGYHSFRSLDSPKTENYLSTDWTKQIP